MTDTIRMRDVMIGVCGKLSVTPDEMGSPDTCQPLVSYRQMAIYLCREMTKAGYQRIGAYFGRGHSTA